MAKLHELYPNDVDGTAFYALSLLAASPPNDTSLTSENRALALLTPVFAQYPDHPGLVHYIIHACDTPSLAPRGLKAAEHYGEIAASAPHAVHMPSHIFARLGMWKQDIDSNLGSVAASEAAEANHQSGAFDQLHADDFLLYAYLQSGQETNAKALVEKTAALLTRFESMPHMSTHGMDGMFAAYRNEFPAIYYLEMRDWKCGREPGTGYRFKARGAACDVLDAHDRRGTFTRGQSGAGQLREVQSLAPEISKGKDAYMSIRTFSQIERAKWRHGQPSRRVSREKRSNRCGRAPIYRTR